MDSLERTTPAGDGLVLRLYVAGTAPNSARAEANLRRLLEAAGAEAEGTAVEVIDCLSEPLRALRDGILVTPTLVKVSPGPARTVVGSLSDAVAVARALGLSAPEVAQ